MLLQAVAVARFGLTGIRPACEQERSRTFLCITCAGPASDRKPEFGNDFVEVGPLGQIG